MAQGAAAGNPLGIAAGVLQAAAAVAGGLVATDSLSGAATEFAQTAATGAGLAAEGASSADAFARGDLQGGLLASLGLLLSQTAKALDLGTPAAPSPAPEPPPGYGPQPALPTETAPLAPVTREDLPPRSTVNFYFCRWQHDGTLDRLHHSLYVRCREQADRAASPTAAIVTRRRVPGIDSQSVKSAEKGAPDRSAGLRWRQEDPRQEAARPRRHARPADGGHRPRCRHPGSLGRQ